MGSEMCIRDRLWVQGSLWNPRRVAGRIPVEILIDTGAGEGNYISMAFWRSIQSWGGSAGQRKLNRRGSGSLQAANPVGSKAPGMEIVGTTVLPVVLPPEDRARDIAVRVVRGLPYAFNPRCKLLQDQQQRGLTRRG